MKIQYQMIDQPTQQGHIMLDTLAGAFLLVAVFCFIISMRD
jgi:hypothetical protein